MRPNELMHDWTSQHRPRWWPPGAGAISKRILETDRRASKFRTSTLQNSDAKR